MALIHRLWQSPLVRILAGVGLFGNLILLYLYVSSQESEIDTNSITDENGVPLFLHGPLENDFHRNSLNKNHRDTVRIDLISKRKIETEDKLVKKTGSPDTVYKHNGNFHQVPALQSFRIDKNPALPDNSLDRRVQDIIRNNGKQVIPIKLLQSGTPKVHFSTSKPTYTGEFHIGDEEMAFDQDSEHKRLWRERQSLAMEMGTDIDPSKIEELITPAFACKGDWEIYILMAVCSDVRRVELRESIRKTWASDLSNQRIVTNVVFVVGKPQGNNKDLARVVSEEAEQYGDILLLDLEDRYSSLTLKSMAMFYWARKTCLSAKYIMKLDDDVFVNVPNLIDVLKTMDEKGPSQFMFGHVIDGAVPSKDRKDKWYMPVGKFKGKTFPTYLSGSAYIFPYSIIEALIQESQEVDFFWLEDIYVTGMLASNLNVPLIHNSKFEFKKRKLGPCRFRLLITAHEMSPDDLTYVWQEMNNEKLKCTHNAASEKILLL